MLLNYALIDNLAVLEYILLSSTLEYFRVQLCHSSTLPVSGCCSIHTRNTLPLGTGYSPTVILNLVLATTSTIVYTLYSTFTLCGPNPPYTFTSYGLHPPYCCFVPAVPVALSCPIAADAPAGNAANLYTALYDCVINSRCLRCTGMRTIHGIQFEYTHPIHHSNLWTVDKQMLSINPKHRPGCTKLIEYLYLFWCSSLTCTLHILTYHACKHRNAETVRL